MHAVSSQRCSQCISRRLRPA